MLIRGPARATLGTQCSQARCVFPPVTSRSPRPRWSAQAQVPWRGEARLAPPVIVHAARALPPIARFQHGAEQRVRAAHPTRHEIDPALRIEPAAGQPVKAGVEGGFGGVEGEEGLHLLSVTARKRKGDTTKMVSPSSINDGIGGATRR